MEKLLIFDSAKEVRFGKLLKFIIPTYLTALFNTVYTIVDGIFVSSYVGTNALAAINIVYPIVNILTGIALAFATGGSALAALHIGGERKEEANRTFSVSMLLSLLVGCGVSALIWIKLPALLELLGATQLTMSDCKTYAFWWLVGTPVVIGKELLTYFIRVDGSPTYSFLTALAGGLLNIVLDYVFVGCMDMGILGAALATILGLLLSFSMGLYYFVKKKHTLEFTFRGLSFKIGFNCMINGTSEFVNQLAIAITTIVFNRTADGVCRRRWDSCCLHYYVCCNFCFIGIYSGFSMGMAPPLGYAYGDKKLDVCRALERYAYRFFQIAPIVIYALTFFSWHQCVYLFFADKP